MKRHFRCAVLLTAVLLVLGPAGGLAERITVPLDGDWRIEESKGAEEIPKSFGHAVPVPGMANLATPAFPNVDMFDSREVISNRISKGMLPESAMVSTRGVPRQDRNYFWYQRTFRAPARKQAAILKVNKAQFGTAVWLNGEKIGEHLGCFTAGYFNATEAMDWAGDNQLIVRIGAHPGVLPEDQPCGTDFEKNKWTPGIYDSVSLLLSDNPVIETIQVAPHIQTSMIEVQTKLKNHASTAQAFELFHRVRTWKERRVVATAGERVKLEPGQEKTVTQMLRIPNARLWSPEDPFLYVLESSTGGDSATTRFGMREFRFDTPTRRAYLNGKVYFLRGSNITLHRFFEDPKCGRMPWTESWVRKLLAEIPKKMNWNSFRFCIGPAPDRWLEIADEAGLLIQNEYFIWTGHSSWSGRYRQAWPADVLIREYSEWMRDNWNHPSVAIWDANNESYDPVYAEKVIPAVRGLDLSNRPWENSYNVPAGPDDPVEDHPYQHSRTQFQPDKPFRMTEFEEHSGRGRGPYVPSGHAAIINEYGWLWLNRDGTPTVLTDKVYENLLGANATAEERFAMNAYLLAGKTEFWRAYRDYAGVLHFVYLMSSYPGVYTSDHFRDIEKLELEPRFAEWVGEAFKPLGVYIRFWQPELKADEEREFVVMMVNDYARAAKGRLALSLGDTAKAETSFAIPANGQETYVLRLRAPDAPGKYLLKATAQPEGPDAPGPTVSRRHVAIVAKP